MHCCLAHKLYYQSSKMPVQLIKNMNSLIMSRQSKNLRHHCF